MSGTDKTDQFDDDFLDLDDEDLSFGDEESADLDDDLLLDDDLDEEWDEFDDEAPAAAAIESNEDRPKSFVSRYFNIIVILLAVTLGGGFMYMKFFSSPSAPANSVAPATAATNGVSASDTTQASNEASIPVDLNNLRLNDERIEATLPYEDEIAQLSQQAEQISNNVAGIEDFAALELAPEDDLFAEDFDESNLKDDTDDPSVIQPPTRVKPRQRLTPMPDFGSTTSQNPAIISRAPTEPQATISVETAPVAMEPITMIEDKPADNQVIEPLIVDTPASTDIIDEEALKAAEAAANEKIEMLANENLELQNSLSSVLAETTSLEKTVAALEAKIAQMEAADKVIDIKPEPAQTLKAEVTQPKQVAEAQNAAQPQKTVAAKTVPKKVVSQAKPQWVLRSAQPGSAVLRDEKTGNSLTVKVGQNVPSLGSITFIGLKNGRWSVVGTTATITR